MPVDAFDNHLKIPFVEERLCRLPKNTPGFLSFAFCADAPPLLQVPHRPGLHAVLSVMAHDTETRKGHREAARIGTDGEAQNTWRLPCAPHRGHRRIRARFLLYACRISRSAALHPKRTPHRTSFPERRICQPSFNIGTGSLAQTSPRTSGKHTP